MQIKNKNKIRNKIRKKREEAETLEHGPTF